MRISDWSSDVCSSDLKGTDAQENQRKTEVGSVNRRGRRRTRDAPIRLVIHTRIHNGYDPEATDSATAWRGRVRRSRPFRSEEHTSELQSLMRISYAVL